LVLFGGGFSLDVVARFMAFEGGCAGGNPASELPMPDMPIFSLIFLFVLQNPRVLATALAARK
jgi:hypothetical protein